MKWYEHKILHCNTGCKTNGGKIANCTRGLSIHWKKQEETMQNYANQVTLLSSGKSRAQQCAAYAVVCVKKGCICPYLLVDALSNASEVALPPSFQLRAGKRPLPASPCFVLRALYPTSLLFVQTVACLPACVISQPFRGLGSPGHAAPGAAPFPAAPDSSLEDLLFLLPTPPGPKGSPGRRLAFCPNFSLLQHPTSTPGKAIPGSYLFPLGWPFPKQAP